MMANTPLVNKTTISSRNKISQTNGVHQQDILTASNKTKTMAPPSQIARTSGLRAPAPPSLAGLANGFTGTILDNARQSPTPSASSYFNNAISKQSSHLSSRTAASSTTTSNGHAHTTRKTATTTAQDPRGLNKPNGHHPLASRLPPHTTSKVGKLNPTVRNAIPSTQSRILAPQSRLAQQAASSQLNSRSSSTVSTLSSMTSTSRRPNSAQTLSGAASKENANQNPIPATNTVRKGLAKFSNPIECQRQFQTLSLKLRQSNEIIEAREKEIDKLQEQLKHSINVGIAYATTMQYFAKKLKLDSKLDLEKECEQLKSRVDELVVNEREYEGKLSAIVDDYKNHLQVELDLRNNLERELEETRATNIKDLSALKEAHQDELDDLNKRHSSFADELQDKIENLESELAIKSKELVDLRKDYEALNNDYSKLEESLTKDKDARVKYAQEKITQLQKDVDSLNSVLEMRLERIHALEKDSLQLVEVQIELTNQKDLNKALNQQMESVNAALEKRREQFETLVAEHEQLRQELTRERRERRRMTMKTEQLEYVLNESCASESNMVFNSSVRDIDSADHLV